MKVADLFPPLDRSKFAELVREQQLRLERDIAFVARHGDDDTARAALALLVELWRGRLGLKPWAVFAATSPEPRRTGRTTRALLGALAEAAARELTLSITCGSYDSHGERYCVRLAREMAAELGLEHNGRGLVIKPERIARISGRARVMYVDHFDDRHPTP